MVRVGARLMPTRDATGRGDRKALAVAGYEITRVSGGQPDDDQGVTRDAPIFSLVLSKSRDWRHHDCSGAKPFLMDCNHRGHPDRGGTSIRTFRRSSPSNFQSRSFLLGGRRGLAWDQSMAPLSWDNCVVLRALDTAPINASIRLLEAAECRDGRRIPPLSSALASRAHPRRLCRPRRQRPSARLSVLAEQSDR
jgi:hypothetical protein